MSFLLESGFWFAVLRNATPVLFATLGVAITSKGGMINLAQEGIMLTSALVGVVASAYSQSLLVGLLCGIASGLLIGLLFSIFTLRLKANMVITGVAINLAATGGTVFVLNAITGDRAISYALKSLSFPRFEIPLIKEIPFLGGVLSGHNILTYVSLICVVLMYILLYKTSFGRKIRAVGENQEAAKSVGIDVFKIKTFCSLISGALGSLGGMFLSMGYINMFTAGMVSGRGYIALATNSIAGGHPILGFLSSLFYGFADSLSNYMRNTGFPLELIQAFPYLFIVVIFSIIMFRLKKKNLLRN